MAQVIQSWRTSLRQYLAARIGTKLTLGALFIEYKDRISLHHATRLWMAKHKQLGDVDHMLWIALCHELSDYDLLFDRRSKPWRADMSFTVPGRHCAICHRVFFARRKHQTCSRFCGGKLRSTKRAALGCADANAMLWDVLDQLEQNHGSPAVRDAIQGWWKRHSDYRHRANGKAFSEEQTT